MSSTLLASAPLTQTANFGRVASTSELEEGLARIINRMSRWIAVLLVLTPVQTYAAEQPAARYCFSEQLRGTSGRESIDLGPAYASVLIRGSADQQTIRFISEMPAGLPGVRFAAPIVLTRAGSDEYSFTFIDGWDDRGEGFVTLTADMAKIHFGEITFPDHGRNGAVNYRDLTLTTAACGR